METILRDLKHSLRTLRKSPMFTVVAIATLALGIGVNTAIFSMVNGILLSALPYSHSEALYGIREFMPQFTEYGSSIPVNAGNFLAWEKESHSFSAMAMIDSSDGSLLSTQRPAWLYGAGISSDFFSVLGSLPVMGRAFQFADGTATKPEMILTYRLWRDVFHSDPEILGKVANLSGRGMTIIGVLPANFVFPHILPHDPDYLVPFGWVASNIKPGVFSHNYAVIARLKAGVTPSEALAELNVVEARIAQQTADGKFSLFAVVTPLKTEIVGTIGDALLMLAMAAGLVLLIVCANLASLLVSRNSKRVREVALRSVLGASHWRLARQFLSEIVLLAAAGGGLGLLLADGALRLFVGHAPAGIPRLDEIRLDSNVLWFTLAVSMFSALVFGLLPSFGAMRADSAEALKSSSRTTTAGKHGVRLRSGLVVCEIALCAVLLPVCLLLIQSLRHVAEANRWLNEERVITADLHVHVPASQIASENSEAIQSQARKRVFNSIEEKIAQLPGVESVGFTNTLPLEGSGWGDSINFREKPLPDAEQPSGEFRFVSPGYFTAIGLSLIKGRSFQRQDSGQSVAVISQSVAQKLVGGRDPLGMNVECGHFSVGKEQWCRVIGVVSDARAESDVAPLLAVYFPLWLYSPPLESLVVRTTMDSTAAAGAIREAIWSVDPTLGIPQERTLGTILSTAEAPRRYETSLVIVFAVCAVLLAMLGLYAVISYSVTQRTHEIGVRSALGAQKIDVLRMVVGEAMLLAGIGVAAGIAGALALARLLRTMLFEIQPTDPPTFIAVAILLGLVALGACLIPAQRAMRIEPMEALRYE